MSDVGVVSDADIWLAALLAKKGQKNERKPQLLFSYTKAQVLFYNKQQQRVVRNK